ncbi:MAG: tRNA preQ1(34) S-adenosylmethionine ribosyltransferase-isomerase QueA [Mastigocoleus sp. MO_167.B18]|nr:tRNA preQ1(34) S-adenosylmethionine ribosyltransferase-isomerase QueA [Mastigocoleus sp. MO_167.B18]
MQQHTPDLLRENHELDFNLQGYDYELPSEFIAQNPVVPRDSSKLLLVNTLSTQGEQANGHYIFRELPEILKPGDLLVMNNTQVIPARLYGRKSTGAEVEVLLLQEQQSNCWLALVKPGKRFKLGTKIIFTAGGNQPENGEGTFPNCLTATVLETDEATGGRLLQFDLPSGVSLLQCLDKFGEVPFPPYITDTEAASEQYQTVYAKNPGAVAAPTAGLHFTPELLEKLSQKGIGRSFVTLHVGVGTFRPVEVENVTTHQMHEEWIDVKSETVEKIRQTKAAGGRVIAVGTTVARSLEGAAISGEIQPFTGKTDIFIYPGYEWRAIDGLITNFHLPRSSLMMMVSALIGRQKLLDVYQEAIALKYRFYSFGDAMLILP